MTMAVLVDIVLFGDKCFAKQEAKVSKCGHGH